MDLCSLIERNAAFAPDKPAIIFEGDALSYAAFDARIAQAARALKAELGVGRGDRVAILSLNRPDYLVLLYACARLGAILVPLNWRLAVAEQIFILSDAAPRCWSWNRPSREFSRARTDATRHDCGRTGFFAGTRTCLRSAVGESPRRRAQSAYRPLLPTADRLHFGHDGAPEGRGAAAGRVAVERCDEPAHARPDLRRSYSDRAALLPCRGSQHPDHAGIAPRRDRHHSRSLRSRHDAPCFCRGQANADRAGPRHDPGCH